MTDSVCWIEIDQHPALQAQVQNAFPLSRFAQDGSIHMPSRYLWINELRSWAKRTQLPVQYPDRGYIVESVTVDKQGLLRFLDDLFGAQPDDYIRCVRNLVEHHANDGERFGIFADEY